MVHQRQDTNRWLMALVRDNRNLCSSFYLLFWLRTDSQISTSFLLISDFNSVAYFHLSMKPLPAKNLSSLRQLSYHLSFSLNFFYYCNNWSNCFELNFGYCIFCSFLHAWCFSRVYNSFHIFKFSVNTFPLSL